MLNRKGIADGYKLDSNIPVVNKSSILFTVIFGSELNKFAKYLARNDVKLIKEVAGTKIYMQVLNPKATQ